MSKRPAYRVCPRCGAHLDSCEICDCAKAEGRKSVISMCTKIVNCTFAQELSAMKGVQK